MCKDVMTGSGRSGHTSAGLHLAKVKRCVDRRALERPGDLGEKKYLGVSQMPGKHWKCLYAASKEGFRCGICSLLLRGDI